MDTELKTNELSVLICVYPWLEWEGLALILGLEWRIRDLPEIGFVFASCPQAAVSRRLSEDSFWLG
jgi:hypothetical protein